MSTLVQLSADVWIDPAAVRAVAVRASSRPFRDPLSGIEYDAYIVVEMQHERYRVPHHGLAEARAAAERLLGSAPAGQNGASNRLADVPDFLRRVRITAASAAPDACGHPKAQRAPVGTGQPKAQHKEVPA